VEKHALLIPGATAAAGTKTVSAPYDGALLAEISSSDLGHVETALATAHGLYRNRKAWLPLHQRVDILERTAAIMVARKEALIRTATAEGGKPWRDTEVEVNRAIDGIHICIETIRAEQGEVIPMGSAASSAHRIAFTRREPIGVVVAVSAFNHPLNLIVHQVAAGIAAGCPVVVKPAELTPLSCISFVKILHEAGLPEEWCQVLIAANRDTATALVTDPRVGFFSFIGSAAVGWMLRSKLAPGVRCALEHGGVAPLILAEDADLSLAIPSITKGGFYHAGQVCVSVQRVYAHSSLAGKFAEALAVQAQKLIVGDPLNADTDVGPLIKHAEVERVHDWVRSADTLTLCGGEPVSESCYAPTVLVDPPADALVSTKEIFGPVVCVYSYDEIDAAIEQANSLPVSFQAAVFTRSIDTAMYAYSNLDASAVMVNDHTAFRVDGMPFAGLRESGLGVGGIPHTIHDMSIEKMMVIHSPAL
jgi:acyl-CoA reductase-like NAD-dependent aldehyde dehydrogenase